jgi:hypothetical protein
MLGNQRRQQSTILAFHNFHASIYEIGGATELKECAIVWEPGDNVPILQNRGCGETTAKEAHSALFALADCIWTVDSVQTWKPGDNHRYAIRYGSNWLNNHDPNARSPGANNGECDGDNSGAKDRSGDKPISSHLYL